MSAERGLAAGKMRLVSVNVGRPRDVPWNGRIVRTSIWKSPIEGPVRVAAHNLAGDEQSDRSVHGGRDKAVYGYPSEHYPGWRDEMPEAGLPWGVFGENFTTEGLLEDEILIGDALRIGSATFIVTQPRLPCFKLGIRFGSQEVVQRFLHRRCPGFYLSVLDEGVVRAGDAIEIVSRASRSVTVREAFVLRTADGAEEQLRRAVASDALPPAWKEHFRKRLLELSGT